MTDMEALMTLVPAKYLTLANTLVLAGMILGRAYHAVRNGGGLVALWRGLMYGANAPREAKGSGGDAVNEKAFD